MAILSFTLFLAGVEISEAGCTAVSVREVEALMSGAEKLTVHVLAPVENQPSQAQAYETYSFDKEDPSLQQEDDGLTRTTSVVHAPVRSSESQPAKDPRQNWWRPG
ncbi:hypothetical protein H920_11498 [Fukomys damarensis]|uniref:Uncharacterized protein n=1 Tax=Fukomys damarensis TaxID=885580 RepID=A0A091D9C4_FUKDA|nr:hypothetical protein H920_11498 [Fukomys damarensis]